MAAKRKCRERRERETRERERERGMGVIGKYMKRGKEKVRQGTREERE